MFWAMRSSPELALWRIERAGQSAPEAGVYAQRANTVGSLVRACGGASVVVTNEGGSPSVMLAVPSSAKAPMLAGSLASAVGGKHVPAVALPELNGDVVVQLVARPSEFASRDTQSGRDPGEVAALIGASLPAGSWLVASMRPPTRSERRAVKRWFSHRLPGVATHYSHSGDAVLVSFLAGGQDQDTLEALLVAVAAVLPGFDVEVAAVPLKGRSSGALLSAGLGGLGAGATAFLGGPWPVSAGLAGAGALGAGAVATGLVPSELDRLTKDLQVGLPRPPAHKAALLVSAPRKESVDAKGRTRKESAGAYPLARSVFLAGPEQVSALACPHFGSTAGSASTLMRGIPAALSGDIGPVIGYAGADLAPVALSSGDMWSSVFICGAPGTGKSQAVQNLFAFDSLERVRPSGKPGRPGRQNALIAFENKGADGAQGYLDWVAATGDAVLLADLADPSSVAIDMLGASGSAFERAGDLVSAMVYAFGENAIAHRSQNTLRQVFTLALMLTDDDALAAGMSAGASSMEFADALLCSRGEGVGKALFGSAMARYSKMPEGPGRAELGEALTRIEPLYGSSVTPSNRRALCEAPQSKVATLLSVPSWWSPARPRVDFGTVLTNHWALVINTGSPISGGRLADEQVTGVISAMLMHTLRRAIQTHCTGWRELGQSVTIYSDELSLLAGSSGDVIKWLRNQSRSFGCRHVLATQYPEQLHSEVRAAVMGAGTVLWFQQNEPSVIAGAVADLTKDGSSWTSADLSTLEPHHAIVRATVDQRPQPAVPVKMAYWARADKHRFAADQGYGAGT